MRMLMRACARAGARSVTKFAEKWAKQGPNVWHEKWGEDYDGKGACQKYTDKVRACCAAHSQPPAHACCRN